VSSGRTHFILSCTLLGGTAAGCWLLDVPAEYTVPILMGLGTGAVITPDLDLEQSTYTEHLVQRIPLAGGIVTATWLPYAFMFRHRGLSHHWLWGTVGRLLYVAFAIGFWIVWLVGLLAILGLFSGLKGTIAAWDVWLPIQWGLFFLSWWAQDLLHLLTDKIYSDNRKRRKRHRNFVAK
jgi:uncharacterized metal-binding protein